ncbi:MAG: hypothetical protein GY708_13470 [Actinomycetia bacterium]|nr:hypothetical protein [Actinomycetes bacterium]MCP4963111.1 hypothetical protein [Actinomycetes bacterium]
MTRPSAVSSSPFALTGLLLAARLVFLVLTSRNALEFDEVGIKIGAALGCVPPVVLTLDRIETVRAEATDLWVTTRDGSTPTRKR